MGSRKETRHNRTLPGQIRREVTAALGAFIILFNLVAALALPAMASARETSDSYLLAEMVYCGEMGGGPVLPDGGPVPAAKPFCPFCLPLNQGAVDAPQPFDLAAILPEFGILRLPAPAELPRPALADVAAGPSPRGPPSA